MSTPSPNRALVIGGGIGGLSTAIALRRMDIEVSVFEQSEQLLEVGAGVGLQLGAVKALKRMGALDAILEIGGEPLEALELRGYRSGRLLGRLPQLDVGRDVGLYGINVHRGDLLATLAARAGADVINTGSRCVSFDQDADGVTARFEDGREERGAILVGADGLHSTIRQSLHGDTPLRYAGFTVWRAMPEFPQTEVTDANPHQAIGPGGGFGLHPLGTRMYWFAAMAQREGSPDDPQGHKHQLRELFGRWYDPIPAVIDATPEQAIFRSDIHDRKPLERWGSARVTLLGDAAHPTTPTKGQGAGMAIEDAAVLAEELSIDPSLRDRSMLDDALRGYEGRRVPYTAKIVNSSKAMCKIYNPKSRVFTALRNGGLWLAPAVALRKEFVEAVEKDL